MASDTSGETPTDSDAWAPDPVQDGPVSPGGDSAASDAVAPRLRSRTSTAGTAAIDAIMQSMRDQLNPSLGATVALQDALRRSEIQLAPQLASLSRDWMSSGIADSLLAAGASNHGVSAALANIAGLQTDLTRTFAALSMQQTAVDTILAAQIAPRLIETSFFADFAAVGDVVGRLAMSLEPSVRFAGLFASLARYGQVHLEIGALAIDRQLTGSVLGSVGTDAGRRFDRNLDGLPARPIRRRAAVAEFAGDTQSGLVTVAAVTTSELDDDDREELSDHLVGGVLARWEARPSEARHQLLQALKDVDPDLPGWLEAAWDLAEGVTPKASNLMANCTVEVIDRCLRVLSPPDEVLLWLAGQPRRRGMLTDDDKPTRRAKIAFAMRNRAQRDSELAWTQVDALASLLQNIMNTMQGYKHSEAQTVVVMQGWLMSTEGALLQLLVHH